MTLQKSDTVPEEIVRKNWSYGGSGIDPSISYHLNQKRGTDKYRIKQCLYNTRAAPVRASGDAVLDQDAWTRTTIPLRLDTSKPHRYFLAHSFPLTVPDQEQDGAEELCPYTTFNLPLTLLT